MTPTKTELLEEMQQKIATFVEGYDEDLNFNYQVDDLMNEIGEALDRYRDNVVEELSDSEPRLRVQHLNFEKNRLKKRHQQSLKEINEHIKNCERDLK